MRVLTIHQNVNEQDLHGIEGIAEAKHRAQRDQRQGSRGSAQLERKEVLNVVEYRFA